MLNISENSINKDFNKQLFQSFFLLKKQRFKGRILKLFAVLAIIALIGVFLPWTQTIRAKGYVTTRLPSQRPQTIQSVISGQIEEWYVREGDFVEKGDTILHISEVKAEYFDQNLVLRTQEQLDAKESGLVAYRDKVKALEQQYQALLINKTNKLEQNENKILQARNSIQIDSSKLVALDNKLQIAQNQLERTNSLYDGGIKSLTELQEKQAKFQEVQAEYIAQTNKLANKRNELLNYELNRVAIEQDYTEKLSKSLSDKQTAITQLQNTVSDISKLRNQVQNYSIRQGFYYITAPQDGYITKSLKKGIGEIIKEGSEVVSIAPSSMDLAVEMYVKPQDLPLLSIGNESRLKFDGWPAIFIAGWPKEFEGIFTGRVVAIDRFISENGYYRIMISPDVERKAWPSELRVGTGVQTFALLKDVPIWYELWRQLNGFPPDYYKPLDNSGYGIKEKAPIKKVK